MNHILITSENYEDFSRVLPGSELPKKDRFTIGAYTNEGVVAGAISFALTGYQYDIDWLYVMPSMRNQGVATELLDEVFNFIRRTGEVYPLSASYEVTDKDNALYSFFLGRQELETEFDHVRYYVSPAEIAGSERLKRPVEVALEEREFFSLPKQEQNKYLSQITAEHGYLIEDKNAWMGVCIPELCQIVCKDGELMAAVFVMGRNDGNLELSYLYSKNPIATKFVIYRVAQVIMKKYSGARLIFDVVGEKAGPMAKKLFPGAKTVYIYESNW